MRKFISFCIASMLMTLTALAQKSITGRVVDIEGNPLSNVSVVVKNTQVGTTTDANGNFTLTVPPSGRVLVFSSVGMTNQEVNIGNRTSFDITLRNGEGANLEEVVVVGYGVQQRRTLTGAASRIDPKEFSQLVTPSIDKQLSGRAAGVNVVNAGGLVNTPARIRIRGNNSISLDNDPLIIVDGVPIITGNLALSSNHNALADINPADIESMEVLKDGASTAIYGSRAANGVILITTKKGTRGRATANYEVVYGATSAANRFKLLNAEQFVEIANELYINSGQLPLAKMDSAGTNTDWQDNVLVNNAPAQMHTLSLSNNTGKTSYYFSLNYSDQSGIIRTNWNKAYRARLNLDHEINKYIKIGNNLNVARQENNDQNNGSNSLGGAVAASIRALPNVGVYNPNHGTGYNLTPDSTALGQGANLRAIENNYFNIAYLLENNQYNSQTYRIMDVAYLEVTPFAGFKFRSQLAADIYNDYSFQGLQPAHGDGKSSQGIVYNGTRTQHKYNIQNYINYNFKLGRNGFLITAGHELEQNRLRQFTATGSAISDPFFLTRGIVSNTASTPNIAGTLSNSAFESFFGRLNYDFANRYFLQASIRRDGLSSLAPENRYGTFPGFSVGWRLSDEAFWRTNPLLNKVFSDVKLRASYATVGNTFFNFRYISTFGAAPYGNIAGLAPVNQGNPDLQWEQSKKYDIGADISFLRNRFNFTFDWFLNNQDQLIFEVPTPMSAGVPGNNIQQNVGQTQNTGIELSLGGDVIRAGKFTWNLNTNYSNIKNEIISLYTVGKDEVNMIPNGNYNVYEVGQPINMISGYRYAGVNSGNGNPVYYNASGQLVQRNVVGGAYYFANSMSDPTLGAQTSLVQADKVHLGNVLPTYFGAFINSFSYGNFGMEVMFRYSGGNKILNLTAQESLLNLFFQNQGTKILDRWQAPGHVTDVPRIVYGQGNVTNNNNEAISRFVEDGDFLRLQNMVFSYNFSGATFEKRTRGFIRNARVFVQGQNLAVWTKYSGIDPEAFSGAGWDNATTPPVRTISAGLNIGL